MSEELKKQIDYLNHLKTVNLSSPTTLFVVDKKTGKKEELYSPDGYGKFIDGIIARLERTFTQEDVEKVNNIIDASRYEQTVDSMELAKAALNAVGRVEE